MRLVLIPAVTLIVGVVLVVGLRLWQRRGE